jgi:hypothetical protein
MALHEDDAPLVTTWVVAVYATSRRYGGPEEGGWWFTEGELVGLLGSSNDEDDAYGIAYEFNRPLWNEGEPRRDGYDARVVELGRRELRPEVAEARCHLDWDPTPEDYVLRWDVPLYFPEARPHYC